MISTTSCLPQEERARGVAGAKEAVEAPGQSLLVTKVKNRPVLFNFLHREVQLFIYLVLGQQHWCQVLLLMLTANLMLSFLYDADPGRPATSTLNRFSALQQSGHSVSSSSLESDRRVPQR